MATPAREGLVSSGCPLADGGPCPYGDEMLTGYIDGVLTQGDRQRVQLRLETCERCRSMVEELEGIREAALTTRFVQVPDDQWNEAPRSTLSLVCRNLGWAGLALWTLLTLAVLLSTDEQVLESYGRWLVAGGLGSLLLLLLSAALDRWRSAPGDIYRGVQK